MGMVQPRFSDGNGLGQPAGVHALELYKAAAEREFGVTCWTGIETLNGDEYPILRIPVPAGLAKPHRRFAEMERRVHEVVEAVHPELSGLVVIRYVAADGEA